MATQREECNSALSTEKCDLEKTSTLQKVMKGEAPRAVSGAMDEPGLRRSDRDKRLTSKAKECKQSELTKRLLHKIKTFRQFVQDSSEKDLSALPIIELEQIDDRVEKDVEDIEASYDHLLELVDEDLDLKLVDAFKRITTKSNRLARRVRRAIDRASSIKNGSSVGSPSIASRSSRLSSFSWASSRVSAASRMSSVSHPSFCAPSHAASSASSMLRESAIKTAILQSKLQSEKEKAVREEEHMKRIRKQREQLEDEERRIETQRRQDEIKNQLRIEQAITEAVTQYNMIDDQKPVISGLLPSDVDLPNMTQLESSQPPRVSVPSAVSESINQNSTSPSVQSDIATLVRSYSESMALSRIPAPEPAIFSGNPLEYPEWIASFSALIKTKGIPPEEKMHYLKRYLTGSPREAVKTYSLLRTENAFTSAMNMLEERYGSSFLVAEAFRTKLSNWPKISGKDSLGLLQFSDFLSQCKVAMESIQELSLLNDIREHRKLVEKLPEWLRCRWGRMAEETKIRSGMYPSFQELADFLAMEAKIACSPITSIAFQDSSEIVSKPKNINLGVNVLMAGIQNENTNSTKECRFCHNSSHSLAKCETFDRKDMIEKRKFILDNQLCFACLGEGHMSKQCPKRSTCQRCARGHPTCLHINKNDKAGDLRQPHIPEKHKSREENSLEVVCRGVTSTETSARPISSMIVPVWLSSNSNPQKEHLTYALLDTMSDATFALTKTLERVYGSGNNLANHSQQVDLRLTTLTTKNKAIKCQKLDTLMVRAYDSKERIPLPNVYSRDFIPVERTHIPTPETAKKWSHLAGIAHRIHPLKDCDVGLLIGYDCPRALAPKNCITGGDSDPFAVETDLGWSIVGRTDSRKDSRHATGLTCRVMTWEVPKNVKFYPTDKMPASDPDCGITSNDKKRMGSYQRINEHGNAKKGPEANVEFNKSNPSSSSEKAREPSRTHRRTHKQQQLASRSKLPPSVAYKESISSTTNPEVDERSMRLTQSRVRGCSKQPANFVSETSANSAAEDKSDVPRTPTSVCPQPVDESLNESSYLYHTHGNLQFSKKEDAASDIDKKNDQIVNKSDRTYSTRRNLRLYEKNYVDFNKNQSETRKKESKLGSTVKIPETVVNTIDKKKCELEEVKDVSLQKMNVKEADTETESSSPVVKISSPVSNEASSLHSEYVSPIKVTESPEVSYPNPNVSGKRVTNERYVIETPPEEESTLSTPVITASLINVPTSYNTPLKLQTNVYKEHTSSKENGLENPIFQTDLSMN